MAAEDAQKVIDRYSAGGPFTITIPQTAELAEAVQVLSGAPLAQIHRMRETFLGAGVND